MNTTRAIVLVATLLLACQLQAQRKYKRMMNDRSQNVYDVCKEAEKYFETHTKGKGSGWKGYHRWRDWNEARYYPSGDRSQADPYYAENAFREFLRNTPTPKTSFPSAWRDLGPYDANTITTGYNPGIGRVECFYVNPTNTQNIYMGSRSGGFWRTTDGGLNWQNTTDFLVASGVNTMDASPTNADSVLVNVRNASNGVSQGIYQSGDGGQSWNATNFSPTNLNWMGLGNYGLVYKIAYHPTVPDLVFVGTSEGLYRSTDNLQTWTQLVPSYNVRDIEFHPNNPSIIYIYENYYWGSNQNNIFRSTDMGLTFSPSAPLTGNNGSECFIAVTPVCLNCVFVASDDGVWRSNDAGQTFSFLSNPSSSCDGFAISDVDTLHMHYGYLDTYFSNDGGYNFTQTTAWANTNPDSTYIHADLRAAECLNGVFYAGTDGYLALSPDFGANWYRINDGTGVREFYAVGLSQSNWNVQMAGSQDNGTSIRNANGWIEWNGGDGMEAVVQPLNDQWMIGSWQFGTRQRTKDGGQTRHGISSPTDGDWQAPMFFDPNLQMKVYHCSDSLYASYEFGNGWQAIGSPSFTTSGDIEVGAISYNNPSHIILTYREEIELSQDSGQTWASIRGTLPNSWVSDVAFAPHNEDIIVVTYSSIAANNQKVFVSYDKGQTWTNITYNIGNMPIHSVVVDHTDAHNIYIAGEIGVYTMPLGGSSWTLYNQGLPNTTPRDLEIHVGANVIRAATWGRGLWEYTLVGRNNYPSILITTITDPPTQEKPKMGEPQHVTSTISYANNLSSVYVKWSVNQPTFDSTIVMTNIVDSTWQTQTPIPGQAAGSRLYFKVYAVGSSGDTSETHKFMYQARSYEYCSASGNMDYSTAMTLVDFAGINRSSGKVQPYTDYSATDSATVTVSNNYNLAVNLNTDGNYMIYAKVWIDWNQDFDFDDVGEEYDLGTAVNTTNGPTTLSPITVAVPANAVVGKTKMRVACRYSSVPTACQNGVDGEVEDYSVVVQPNGLSMDRLTNQKFQIYPNPTTGKFTVDLGKVFEAITIEIVDAKGKSIRTQHFEQKQLLDLLIEGAAGPYLIKINADEAFGTFKIIKQ